MSHFGIRHRELPRYSDQPHPWSRNLAPQQRADSEKRNVYRQTFQEEFQVRHLKFLNSGSKGNLARWKETMMRLEYSR